MVYELIKLGAPLIDKNAKINFNVKTKDGKDTGIESNILLFAIFKKDEELLKAIISKAKEDNILQNLLEDKDNTFTKKPNDILDGITSDEYKAIKTTFQEATK